jgi:hypothetical protein
VQELRRGDAFKAKGAEPSQQCGSGGLIAAGIVLKGDGYGKEIDSGTFDALAILVLLFFITIFFNDLFCECANRSIRLWP